MKNRGYRVKYYLVPMFLTGLIMLSLLAAGQYAPFGNNSLAAMDADIQYLDFFAYFKDVLSGKNNIAYTLGKTLGGTNIAVFSYYLSSPFSLLLVFFSKDRLETFFDFVVTLKLMTCALTFCNFTVHRFRKSISSLWKKTIVVVLSVSYALCQYCIAQSSNIMWLDGVYLLPLFLLQVYRVAKLDGFGRNMLCNVPIKTIMCRRG